MLASAQQACAEDNLRVAVASTVDNAGLAAMLADGFEQSCECDVRMIAAGSTRALAIAAAGDAAVAITHAPDLEREFVQSAAGRTRTEFMANEFVLAGPPDDPAGVEGKGLVAALRLVQEAGAPFVSRADGSGTNLAELALWREALGEPPRPSQWYRQAGVQMAAALQIAQQTGAYTLSDSGSLAVLRENGAISIDALSKDSPPLRNTYSVIVADANDDLAASFARWLAEEEARSLIQGLVVASTPAFVPLP